MPAQFGPKLYRRLDASQILLSPDKTEMTDLLSSLRAWWRWRMRRSQVHIPGIVEFRMVGTVVALQDGSFSVSNDPDGQTCCVQANPWIAEIKLGDRVEIEPMFASAASGRWNARSVPEWVLVRKLDPSRREERAEPGTHFA